LTCYKCFCLWLAALASKSIAENNLPHIGANARVLAVPVNEQKALDSAYYQLTLLPAGTPGKATAIAALPCPEHQQPPVNMSTEPKKEETDKKTTEDVEVKLVPEGTFGGTIEKPILINKKGETIPEDTGDQGGGQN
jgi:hypothetical protein